MTRTRTASTVWRRPWLAALCLPLLAACSQQPDGVFQGYAEGEFVYLASAQPGRLETLAVQRGQQVAQGAALFALDDTREAAARAEARARGDAARAQLRDIGTGKRPAEIDVARAQLNQARAEAGRTDAQLARDTAQFRIGGIARQQLDDSRAAARANQARVQELQAQLAVAELPGRDQQQAAQSAEVAAAEATLAQADWTLAQMRVAAPAAGLVYDTLYRVGEWVPAGSPVVRLLPPANIKVRFYVPPAALGRLQVGQSVQLRCDGCGEPVAARVSYVSNEAEYTPPVIYSRDRREKLVFLVEAHPAPADAARLHPGQPLEVSLP